MRPKRQKYKLPSTTPQLYFPTEGSPNYVVSNKWVTVLWKFGSPRLLRPGEALSQEYEATAQVKGDSNSESDRSQERPFGELFRDMQAHCVHVLRAPRSLQNKVLISTFALCTAIFFPMKAASRGELSRKTGLDQRRHGLSILPCNGRAPATYAPFPFSLFTCAAQMKYCGTGSLPQRNQALFLQREFCEILQGQAHVRCRIIKTLFLERKTGWVRVERLLGWGGQGRVEEITYRTFSIQSRFTLTTKGGKFSESCIGDVWNF